MAENKKDSILPADMDGLLMVITGLHGIGKTRLAAQAEAPQLVQFIDFDGKSGFLHQQLGFGDYVNLRAETVAKKGVMHSPIDRLAALQTYVTDKKHNNKYTVTIIDNASPVQDALEAEVRRSPNNYGIRADNAQSGKFGGPWKGVNHLMSNVLDQLVLNGVRLTFVILHMKNKWTSQGPLDGTYAPQGSGIFDERTGLTLTLVEGPSYATERIPAGLVSRENIAKARWDPETKRVVYSHRLVMGQKIPRCTWEQILWFWENGVDAANLKDDQKWSNEEIDAYGNKLTSEQVRFLRAMAVNKAREVEAEPAVEE